MLKHILDRNALIKIYFAFIRPILEYGSIVWDNGSQENSVLLENVQVAAGRIITVFEKIHLEMPCTHNQEGNP